MQNNLISLWGDGANFQITSECTKGNGRHVLFCHYRILCSLICKLSFSSFISVEVKVAQLCLTVCDPMECSLPGSYVHGILQARILEWAAIPFSRGSSRLSSNPGLLHCRQIPYHLSHQGSPFFLTLLFKLLLTFVGFKIIYFNKYILKTKDPF